MIQRLVTLLCILSIWANAQVSPEILPDGRVTFRCRAAKAENVSASGQFGPPVTLEKGPDGIWVGTTDKPVKPGVFEYRLKIDDLVTLDSRNPAIKPQRWPGMSILHIPSDPPAHWDIQDIAAGTLHTHTYHSKALDRWRELVIYTPPGSNHEDLPVLYLSHGYSDNQRTWTEHGKAHRILDSLIHLGKAKPMVVVMPDAHATEPVTRTKPYWPKNTKAFCAELLEDVIPLVEGSYDVATTPAKRAFAGLSMGGRHALVLALEHSEHFSQIGAFSAAAPEFDDHKPEAVEPINGRLSLFWIACGDKDFLFERNQAFTSQLKKHKVKHEYLITPGDGHSWPVWRNYLIDFVPRLFQ